MGERADSVSVAVDPVAFASFYDRALPEVFRYLFRGTAGNRPLCEDLAQETFLAAVSAIRRGTVEAMTMPWLMGVARHKLVDHYRRRGREERKLALAWNEAEADGDLRALHDVSPGEALALLDGVPDSYRVVLVLRYLDDLSVAEIARETGRSVHATESLLVRARQSLQRSVREQRDG